MLEKNILLCREEANRAKQFVLKDGIYSGAIVDKISVLTLRNGLNLYCFYFKYDGKNFRGERIGKNIEDLFGYL